MSRLVSLEPNSSSFRADHITRIPVKRALPYIESVRGLYSHRVRNATMYVIDGKTHMGVSCWCGMSLCVGKKSTGQLVGQPSIGRPICATCEGRAIGAGQEASHKINGRLVKFTPQQARNQ